MLASKTPFESKTFKRTYLIGTVIILMGMWAASALILSGMFWFIVVVPGAFFWTRQKST